MALNWQMLYVLDPVLDLTGPVSEPRTEKRLCWIKHDLDYRLRFLGWETQCNSGNKTAHTQLAYFHCVSNPPSPAAARHLFHLDTSDLHILKEMRKSNRF